MYEVTQLRDVPCPEMFLIIFAVDCVNSRGHYQPVHCKMYGPDADLMTKDRDILRCANDM